MVQDGDKITIDAESRELKLGISKAELKRRTASWKKTQTQLHHWRPRQVRPPTTSASQGAVTDLIWICDSKYDN